MAFVHMGKITAKHNTLQIPEDIFEIEFDEGIGQIRFKQLSTAAQVNSVIGQPITDAIWEMRHETPEGEYTFEPPTNPDDMYPVGYFTLPGGSVKVPTNEDISTELRDYLTAFIGNNIVGALTPGMITMVPRKWGVVSFTNLDSSIVTNATLQIVRCPYTKEGYFSLVDDLPYDGINDVSEIASMTLVPSNIFYTVDIPLDVTIDGITKVFPVNSPITDLTDPIVSQLIAKGFSDDWDTVIVFTSELDGGGETGGSTRVFIIKNGKALVRNGKILSIN